MKIHEYQAKKILKSFGVAIATGHIAYTPEEARRVAGELGTPPWVVKAQIHAGGRGKGGGIKLAHNQDEVESFARQMFQKALITPQTGPEGKIVRRVYIEKGCKIAKELYL
ncbi:MAG: acetate--CoA ligase family protein, partial [Alphaproteobacteria bacterium]|nr:acetate--CoA ligase family protein [Alphaproteobacteria bacterium]